MKDYLEQYLNHQVEHSNKKTVFKWFMRIIAPLLSVTGVAGLIVDAPNAFNEGIASRNGVLYIAVTVLTVYSIYISFFILRNKPFQYLVTNTGIFLSIISFINLVLTLTFSFSDAPLIFSFTVVVHVVVVVYGMLVATIYKRSLANIGND